MIRYIIIFLTGVFVGQEYGDVIPNVRLKTIEMYREFKKTYK